MSEEENDKKQNPQSGGSLERLTFPKVLGRFLTDIRAISRAYPITVSAMRAGLSDSAEKFSRAMEKYCRPEDFEKFKALVALKGKPAKGPLGKIDLQFTIPEGEEHSFLKDAREFGDMSSAENLVKRSFIFSLISQYDAFIGNLVRVLFNVRPEILNSSEKALSFSQLKEFGTIEDARQHIVDREVETVLRDSHSAHFEWLERKLSLNLRNGLDAWPAFIELTERRNLFAHTDGIVSQQYMTVCGRNAVKLPESVRPGTRLDVKDEYFRAAYECLFEIGFKLGHVLWRVLREEERERADDQFNERTLNLISEGQFALAAKLLDFFLNGMRNQFSNERVRLVALVNLAQAHKWMGNQGKCLSLLSGQDWSASAPDFLVVTSVLKDDFAAAARFMKVIGESGSIGKEEYRHWPIFRAFREAPEFLNAFREIFGEPFEKQASKPETLEMMVEPTESIQIAPVDSETTNSPPEDPAAQSAPG